MPHSSLSVNICAPQTVCLESSSTAAREEHIRVPMLMQNCTTVIGTRGFPYVGKRCCIWTHRAEQMVAVYLSLPEPVAARPEMGAQTDGPKLDVDG